MPPKATFRYTFALAAIVFACQAAALHPTLPDEPNTPALVTSPMANIGPLTPQDRTLLHDLGLSIDSDEFAWVTIDAGPLESTTNLQPATVRLALSDEVIFDAQVRFAERRSNESTVWSGKVENLEGSLVTLIIHEGTLSAVIHTGLSHSGQHTSVYSIQPLGDGRHVAWEVSPSKLKMCGNPPTGDPVHAVHPKAAQSAETTEHTFGPPLPLVGAAGCDDGTIIDLMVVYTDDARAAAGGVAAMESWINQAVTNANAAFTDSDIDVQMNLVHTQEVAYAESGNWMVDGPRLVDPDDGQLDQVHPLRDQYGADCVSLVVNLLNTGGIGYFPDGTLTGIGNSGFSMVRRQTVPGNILTHELGHNLYCAHDRPHNTDVPYTDYAYGYVEPGGAWQTIMAVEPTATYIPYFSNPNNFWPGPNPPNPGPMGVAEGNPNACDVAQTINETRHFVANFRATSVRGLSPVLRVRAEAAPGGDGSSWAAAFNSLHDATCAYLGSNGAVSEIWLKEGTYKPDGGSGDRSSSFAMSSGLSIYGGFAGTETSLSQRDAKTHVTVLSGDIGLPGNASDNCYHVVTASLADATAVLDGVTITGGNANGGDLVGFVEADDGGGGILVAGGGSPKFVDCTITLNTTTGLGAGLFSLFDSTPTMERCRFIDNSATGSAWPSSGGGASNYGGAHTTFVECTFSGNTALFGGGMSTMFDSLPSLDGCTFLDNSCSEGGGAMYNYGNGSPDLVNCLFSGNSAGYGGAMANLFDSDGAAINCTMAGNTATSVSGGVYLQQCAPSLANCVLWANSVGAFMGESAQIGSFSSAPAINYCTIQSWTGGLGGVNNNGSNPLLRDANGPDNVYGTPDDDPRLLAGSPAINTGNNASVPGGVTMDLDGKPRVLAAVVDRGAFETNTGNPFDFDGSGQVGSADYAVLFECLSGPDGTPAPPSPTSVQACLDSFDDNGDADVDLRDVAAFALEFGG